MSQEQQILDFVVSQVGTDKDEIIAFLCRALVTMGEDVSAGYTRTSINPDTREPKPPLDPLST